MTIDLAAPWDSFPIAVIDVETTGLVAGADAIVEIAAVRFERGEVVDSFDALIFPGCPIPEALTAIHGITDAMVARAPRIHDVVGQLFRVCSGAVPCAYNSTFDRAFLHAVITGTDCAAFDPAFPGWLCPLVVVREIDRNVSGSGKNKLTAACKRWGIELTGAHRSLSDATAAGRLLFRLKERGKLRTSSLRSMLETTERKRAQQEADFQAWLAKQPPRAKEQV